MFRRRATVILAIGLNEGMSQTRYRYSCTKIYRWRVAGSLPLSSKITITLACRRRDTVIFELHNARPWAARPRYPETGDWRWAVAGAQPLSPSAVALVLGLLATGPISRVGGGPALLRVTMFRCIRATVIFELGNNAGMSPMRYRYPHNRV